MTISEAGPVTRRPPRGLPERIRHFIDGEFTDSADAATFDVLDPVSNQTYITAAAGGPADIDRAVAAASRAFAEGPWPRLAARERANVLNRIADAVAAQNETLAEIETFDTGLPITQALGPGCSGRRRTSGFSRTLSWLESDDLYQVPGRQVNYVNRKPAGVAGLITPWNTPFMLESWKLAPALAARMHGACSSPPSSPRCPRACGPGSSARPGLPDGVFNLVNGLGESGR